MSDEHVHDATCMKDMRAESSEQPEHLLELERPAIEGIRAAGGRLSDPTDQILLSPNRTRGWPQGQPSGVTIHTEEGFHDSSVALLRNPNTQASAHFCVRRDGHITQLVWERDRA